MKRIHRNLREDEFTEFVTTYGRRLRRMAGYLSGDPHGADDLLQNALTKTYLAWPSARRTNPYTYARRVLTNTSIDMWRRRRWREQPPDDDMPDNLVAPDEFARVADAEALQAALRLLTARERGVIVLRFYEDLSTSEVADLLGISTGTVKSTTVRGLAKLRIAPDLTNHSPSIAKEPHHAVN